MAHGKLMLALALAAASAAPAAAAPEARVAPAGTSDTRYCMKIEWITGSRLERVKCWTRAEWAAQGVDVDREWPREGVRVIG